MRELRAANGRKGGTRKASNHPPASQPSVDDVSEANAKQTASNLLGVCQAGASDTSTTSGKQNPSAGYGYGNTDLRDQDPENDQDPGSDPAGGAGGSDADAPFDVPDKPRSVHERYAEHYAAGQTDATGDPYAPPAGVREHGALAQMAQTHARGPDGKPLRGPALDAWFRATAAEYRHAQAAAAQYQRGFAPSKCLEWLQNKRPVATGPPPSAGRIVQRPPPSGRIWKTGESEES